MAWSLIYRDDSNNVRELKSQHASRDDALRQAQETRRRYTVIRIEGPGGVTLDAAGIEKELASGKYAPPGTAVPKQ